MKTFNLNIFQLLIILGSIQGLIFAFIIFLRKKFRIRSNVFLGLMIVFIALSNIQHILIDIEFLPEESIIRKFYFPIQWLIMPMFYLHVYAVLLNKKPKLSLLIATLLPIGIVIVLHSSHLLYYQDKISVAAMPDYNERGLLLYTNFASFIFNLVMIFITYKLLNPSKEITKKLSKNQSEQQKWYKQILLILIVIVTIGFAVAISLIQFNVDQTALIYSLFLLVSFVGYYMGYIGVNRSTRIKDNKNQNNGLLRNGSKTYEKISSQIIEEQLYLDADLNLSEMAQKFNISAGYLSQLINTHSGQNFNDYVNNLRIEASKKMLLAKQFKEYTIESIGLECGFKSKSNFYTAFKKFTEQTPTEFVKNQKIRPIS